MYCQTYTTDMLSSTLNARNAEYNPKVRKLLLPNVKLIVDVALCCRHHENNGAKDYCPNLCFRQDGGHRGEK